jgi:hypothetical protein
MGEWGNHLWVGDDESIEADMKVYMMGDSTPYILSR